MERKSKVREIIKPVIVNWPMSEDLDSINFQINRIVAQLDDVAYAYESKWGIGYLEETAESSNPELAQKWEAQLDKLNNAISSRDLVSLCAIVDGCRRGYSRLEENAYSHGLKPKDDVVIFSYRKGETVFKVVRLIQDEWKAKQPGDDNVVVLSCEAMCRIYPHVWVAGHKNIEDKKDISGTVLEKMHNWPIDDDIPF